ncbi:MAG: hypothetical protein KC657_20890 [Myxococcales bacterium]|nr:hypothetical protein [Myxococcales bacterium]
MATAALQKKPNLIEDQRGAVMLTGLFMSCFLIGSLWFAIGIGDTVVFRDRMQEAADHGAFTSAALHAKGMNFISACNLVLLALVAVHIILGIIHDILLAVCIVSLGFGCGAWLTARRIWTGYFKVLKPAAKAIHVAEVLAAYGYPYIGAYKGYSTGSTYGGRKHGRDAGEVTVIPMGSSMIPGVAMRSKKKGLPVEGKPMKQLCKKLSNMILDLGIQASGRSPRGKVMRIFRSIVGGVVEFRYCNDLGTATGRLGQMDYDKMLQEGNKAIDEVNKDIQAQNQQQQQQQQNGGGGGGGSLQQELQKVQTGTGSSKGGLDPGFDGFWGEEGPLLPWGPARNGSPWMQVWALNMMPEISDTEGPKVAVGAGTKRMGAVRATITPRPTTTVYPAQSEFYFDCTKGWADEECNFDDNAGYQVKWRARLRRVDLPGIGTMLGGWLGEMLGNLKSYKDFKDNAVGNALKRVLGSGGGANGATKGVGEALNVFLETPAKKFLRDMGANFDPTLPDIYH